MLALEEIIKAFLLQHEPYARKSKQDVEMFIVQCRHPCPAVMRHAKASTELLEREGIDSSSVKQDVATELCSRSHMSMKPFSKRSRQTCKVATRKKCSFLFLRPTVTQSVL